MARLKRYWAGLAAVALLATRALAGAHQDCLENPQFSQDVVRGVAACTEVIDNPAYPNSVTTQALAQRALGYSLQGDYAKAIADYDRAIAMFPNFAVALNNRAWALFRSGAPEKGLPDVEKSLRLNPFSGHTFDTRAHIRQWKGDVAGALADYERAIQLDGERMLKLYQCGLAEAGLFKGAQDGKDSPDFRAALKACVSKPRCDPLPADENCRPRTS